MRCKSNYPFRFREWCLCSLLTLGIGGAVSWLFYRSVYGMIGVVPLFFLVKRFMSNYLFTRKKREMLFQFRELMQFLTAALKAGNSMENALCQGLEEYIELYGAHTMMAVEFSEICHKMQLNIPLEQLMEDFGRRSGMEEISSFAQVFSYAKRGGADMMKIMGDTVERIRQKMDVEREIETVVTAKKMEQRIMDVVPFGIVFYVCITSPEFLSPLYGNLPGVCVMTLCLVGYVAALVLSEEMLDIKV